MPENQPVETPPPRKPPRTALAGTLMMAIAMTLIGLVDAIAKYNTASMHGLQVSWIYFVSMLLCLLLSIVCMPARLTFTLRTTQWKKQCLRGFCIAGSLSLLFTGLTWLPLAQATVISFTAPLFMLILAGPLLNEKVSGRMWLVVLVGLLGALLVIRPGSALFRWASLLPLAGAVFFALFNIVTRSIGTKDSLATTLFYTFAVATLVLSVPQAVVWSRPDTISVLQLAAAGAMGVVGHLLIARSLQQTAVSVVAPLNYVRLICALTLGYWWFGEIPDVLSMIGAILIAGCGIYTVYYSTG